MSVRLNTKPFTSSEKASWPVPKSSTAATCWVLASMSSIGVAEKNDTWPVLVMYRPWAVAAPAAASSTGSKNKKNRFI